jgi:hypothetical protein
MTKSYDQTFMLTTGLLTTVQTPKVRNPQSALEAVRSVECGLLA